MSHPTALPDLFTLNVDGLPVEFVRPSDTDRPCWVAYEERQPLGVLHACTTDGITEWTVQTTHERHPTVDDAVRALRQAQGRSRHRSDAIE